ncbi:hypothetical protein L7F22_057420, partial [Adiantum nelumboides]|nr:hypothetical protein [Adiantum nelumboides]
MASKCILLQSYGNYTYKKLEAQYHHEHAETCSAILLVEIGAAFGGKGFALSGEVVLEELVFLENYYLWVVVMLGSKDYCKIGCCVGVAMV